MMGMEVYTLIKSILETVNTKVGYCCSPKLGLLCEEKEEQSKEMCLGHPDSIAQIFMNSIL